MLHGRVWISFVIVVSALGCDDRMLESDADRLDGRVDSGGTSDCAGAADGSVCGAASICLSGACVTSECGDGYIDGAAGEVCDDSNATAFDGCEPGTCQFTCTASTDCDDAQVCNGTETCGASSHVCEPGTSLAPGSPCARAGEPDGACRGSGAAAECAVAGCGNGVVDGTEECEDDNTDNGDGCDNDCTFSCTTDEECSAIDVNVCDGSDVCDTTSHTCGPGTTLDCDDALSCTDDSCEPVGGCVNVDNGTGEFWYADCDEDGYAASDTGAERSCIGTPGTAPAVCSGGGSWTAQRPIGSDIDCLDSNAMVRPGSDAFRTIAIGGALPAADFDYNCDGIEELDRAAGAQTCTCAGGDTWYYDDDPAPVCGALQEFRFNCAIVSGSCSGYWSRARRTDVVACR